MVEELVLFLSDYSKPFEVHIDASDFAMKGVLLEEKYFLAFESKAKWQKKTLYYARKVYDRLWIWRHYLLASKFNMMKDNVAISYFRVRRAWVPNKQDGKISWQSLITSYNIRREKQILLVERSS